jgi:hypothetical protein
MILEIVVRTVLSVTIFVLVLLYVKSFSQVLVRKHVGLHVGFGSGGGGGGGSWWCGRRDLNPGVFSPQLG